MSLPTQPDDNRVELSWGQYRAVIYGPVNIALALLALGLALGCYIGVS